jgi:hypothetical protein
VSVVNLDPGRGYDPRAAVVQGKPSGEPCSFPRVRTTDTVAAAIGIKGGKTITDLTSKASIPAPGKVAFSVDTSGQRITVMVYRPA